MTEILGTVKDIHPKEPQPSLELAFSRAESGWLPHGQSAPITLEIGDSAWRGTMRNDGTRGAYVHTWLANTQGRKVRCTAVFASLGIGHNAQVLFQLVAPDTLRLATVIAPGVVRRTVAPQAERPRRARLKGRRQTSAPEPPHAAASAEPAADGFPFGNCQEIRRLAEVYWTLITPAEARAEREFEQVFPAVRAQGFLSKDLFVRLGRWKSTRPTQYYEANTEQQVRAATAAAFTAADDATAIDAMTQLQGVAVPTATAMLQWMRPDRFPILDRRVVDALNWEHPSSWDNLAFYDRVATRVRALAHACDVDLRTMDRALWAWAKLRSRARV